MKHRAERKNKNQTKAKHKAHLLAYQRKPSRNLLVCLLYCCLTVFVQDLVPQIVHYSPTLTLALHSIYY